MTQDFTLVTDFAVIMAVAGVALVLFRRLKQSAVLGYMLAGLVIGPYTFAFPSIKDVGTIKLLADLGLVLLMFGTGLDFGWERIRQIGARVILIALIETTIMIAIGYEVGSLLGWSGTEAFFLGAALAITSSAVLIKVLQDTGKLNTINGRLIVGISVAEDLVAVALLSILSGVADAGTVELADIAPLVGKLLIFGVSALVLGRLLAPRIIRSVAEFQSKEVLLIASLAMCFGLAFLGLELGLSAAAGAFLIGTVLGDSAHAKEITQTMSPIRDMFGALFFVSIGMLVDPADIVRFIGPVLVVAAVFILGKIVATTIATFLTGQDGRTALGVGMGMPQMGEFSLAMAKVGVDKSAVGASFYPVVAATTAITALVYPYVFRSADRTAGFLERHSPSFLKQYVASLGIFGATLRPALNFDGELGRRIKRTGRTALINLGIILVLLTAATFILRLSREVSGLVRIPESIFAPVISGGVIALCIPSVVILFYTLRTLTDDLTQHILVRAGPLPWRQEYVRSAVRNSMLIFLTLLVGAWGIPLVSRMFQLGGFSLPIAVVLVVVGVLVMVRTGFRLHTVMEATVEQTFLGAEPKAPRGEPAVKE